MGKLHIDYSYVSLEKAGALLGVSANDLIHAGAYDQVQICANIYARATNIRKTRIDENPEAAENELTDAEWAEAEAEAAGYIARYECWLARLKANLMPAGVFEIGTEDLRLFEMSEISDLELVDSFKSDESGLWEVEFINPVKITRADLVILTSEIARLQKIGDITKAVNKPMPTRERDTLLKLVIGMAIKGYRHDPAALRSTASKEIADDLAELGITITDDTVRKYLKQAADTALPAKPRQP